MNSNLIGLILSYTYILLFLFFTSFAAKKGKVQQNIARKIIHIGVCHWWFIAFAMMDSLSWALIGPISFIIINFLIAKFNLIPSMNSSDGRNFGTVYFPITLVLLLLAVYRLGVSPVIAGIGVMVMGWGDGMAGIIGEKVPSPALSIWGNRKSLSGSLAMFLFSLVVAVIGFVWAGAEGVFLSALAAALVGTVFEFFTPLGLDNLTVPLAVTYTAHLLAGL